jgi:hypothetical protein
VAAAETDSVASKAHGPVSLARCGDPSGISGYLGKSDVFDEAIATFTFACSDQTEAEHAARGRAIPNAELEAVIGESG